MTDCSSPFGTYAHTMTSRLLRMCAALPANVPGYHVSRVLRRVTLDAGSFPADICIEGLRLRSYPQHNASERKFVFTPWRYDPLERAFIASKLPSGGVFVDIGANIGIYSLWAAVRLGSTGTVVSFEANPAAHERLVYNMRVNQQQRDRWPTTHLLNLAVSDAAGEFDLNLMPHNLGASSLVSHSESTLKIKVKTVVLLDELRGRAVDRIDILKIDIEGAEDLALAPFFADAPATMLPRAMIIESSDHRWRVDLGEVFARHGYRVVATTDLNRIYERT